MCDTLTLTNDIYPSLIPTGEKIETTLGRLIFNKMMVEFVGLTDIIPYQNITMDKKGYGKFEATVSGALKTDKIDVPTIKRFIDIRDWFGFQFHTTITSSFSLKTTKVPDSVKKLKEKLLKENAEAIKKGDARVVEGIEKQLIDAIMKEFKGDIGMDLYTSGARGSVGNHLKNMFLMRGAVENPYTKEYEIIENSLCDGLAKKDIATHSNVIVSGAYPKACGTQVSGYMAKQLLAAFQTEVTGPKGSDCGSEMYLEVKLDSGNINGYINRYVKTNNGLLEITEENKSKLIDKTVKMRSPMFCAGYGKEKCICNACAGNFYYNLGKQNIGLLASICATDITQMNLQKFHQNLVTSVQLDVNDLLI